MADEGDKQGSTWPLPKFYFSVNLGDAGQVPFQEVTGLNTESETISYRAGDSKAFNVIKMPGLIKSGNVTLKKGIFVNDTKFWDWFSKINMNLIKRQAVTISLLDQDAKAAMVWNLQNAFPVKILGADLKSDGNEVAVETLELAHEKLTITKK